MRSASITISMDINNNKNSNQRENARSHRPVSQLFPDPGLPDGLFEVMHAWPGAGAERLFNQNSNCIQSSNQYGTRRNLNRKHLFSTKRYLQSVLQQQKRGVHVQGMMFILTTLRI